jgi:ATP-dependent RNA helicase DeaD
MVDDYQHEYGVPVIEIAAALGALAQGTRPLPGKAAAADSAGTPARAGKGPEARSKPAHKTDREARPRTAREAAPRPDRPARVVPEPERSKPAAQAQPPRTRDAVGAETGMERYRIEVGLQHGVKPGNIVGAIANEAEIESEYIGRIEIFDDYSTVQLPEGMPREIFKHLKSVWVSGQRLQISRLDSTGKGAAARHSPRDGGKPARKQKAAPQSKPG